MKTSVSDKFLYSASDLTSFLGCTHSTWMDYQTLLVGDNIPRSEAESFDELLMEKGLKHESIYLEKLKSTFNNVVEIPGSAPFENQVDLKCLQILFFRN